MTATTQDILVFGATGGTGQHLVRKALDAGHRVTAFVRSPARLGLQHEGLRTIVGDVTDPEQVRAAVAGHDAVVSAIGAPPSGRDRVRERGTRAIVEAMRRTGVQRLISLSSHGIAETRQSLPWFLRWILVPLYLGRAFDDHERQEAAIRGSGLSWTIVRPPHLTDAEGTGNVHHSTDPDAPIRMRIARADVAAFMLAQLGDDRYACKAPTIWS